MTRATKETKNERSIAGNWMPSFVPIRNRYPQTPNSVMEPTELPLNFKIDLHQPIITLFSMSNR